MSVVQALKECGVAFSLNHNLVTDIYSAKIGSVEEGYVAQTDTLESLADAEVWLDRTVRAEFPKSPYAMAAKDAVEPAPLPDHSAPPPAPVFVPEVAAQPEPEPFVPPVIEPVDTQPPAPEGNPAPAEPVG